MFSLVGVFVCDRPYFYLPCIITCSSRMRLVGFKSELFLTLVEIVQFRVINLITLFNKSIIN